MIRLYNTQGVPAYPLADIENFCVVHTFEGDDSLTFDISPKHPLYPNIAEEIKLEYGDNIYVIKGINERTDRSTVNAFLDLDRFRDSFFPLYEPASPVTITEALRQVLPSGFTILGDVDFSQTRTLKLERATGLDLLNACQEEFGLVYQWNLKGQTVTLVDPETRTPRGTYLTDELNLESVSFKGDSQNCVTRLYPFGKDGMGIESSGDGLPYVENHTYSDRILCGFWSDTSFEDSGALREAAVEKLKGLCVPERSYECSVIDLAKLNPAYAQLTFALYDVVTLLDRNRKTRVNHQIVEYKEYPDEPRRNVITLSNKTKTIKNTISSTIKEIITEVDSTKTDLQTAIEKATQAITGNSGGHVVLYPPENPEEILILDKPSVEQARNVWRWNKEGLGHSATGFDGPYSLAILANGQISADFITTGHLSANLIQSGILQAQSGDTQINLNNGTFKFGEDKLVLKDGTLTMRGTVQSDYGTIAGWNITPNGFMGEDSHAGMCSTQAHGGIAYWAGAPDGQSIGDAKFIVFHDGHIAAQRLELSSTTGGIMFGIIGDPSDPKPPPVIDANLKHGLYIQAIKRMLLCTTKSVHIMHTNKSDYMPLYASNISTPSSERFKCNIQEFGRDALPLLKQSKIYEYNLNIDVEEKRGREASPNHIGFVIERETPAEVLDESGEAVSLNHMCSILWKAVQEQQQIIEEMQLRLDSLERQKGV